MSHCYETASTSSTSGKTPESGSTFPGLTGPRRMLTMGPSRRTRSLLLPRWARVWAFTSSSKPLLNKCSSFALFLQGLALSLHFLYFFWKIRYHCYISLQVTFGFKNFQNSHRKIWLVDEFSKLHPCIEDYGWFGKLSNSCSWRRDKEHWPEKFRAH